jgi:hypothetical protein
MWSVDCSFRIYAEVLFVTEKGGIRVRNQHGQELWVPYHHVINSDAGVCWWKEDSFVTDDVK